MHVTRTLRSSVLTKFEVLIKLVFQSGLRPRNRSRYRAASCRRRIWRPPPSTAAPGRVRAGTDRCRAWGPLLSPRSPPSCRRPRGRQEQALAGARSSRVLDRHSKRRRIQRAAGAKGWLRRTEQKDWTKGKKAFSPVLVTNSPQRGGMTYDLTRAVPSLCTGCSSKQKVPGLKPPFTFRANAHVVPVEAVSTQSVVDR